MANQTEIDQDPLVQLREAFARGEWQKALAIFETMQALVKRKQAVRVEATCLAVRALVAEKERSAGRLLLRRIGGEEYPKAIHYDFLAHAYLALRNYKEVARVCELAAALSEAEKAK